MKRYEVRRFLNVGHYKEYGVWDIERERWSPNWWGDGIYYTSSREDAEDTARALNGKGESYEEEIHDSTGT